MNLLEKWRNHDKRIADLERRLEAMDGKQPVTAGGPTRTVDGSLFLPGSGVIGDDRVSHEGCEDCDGNGDVWNAEWFVGWSLQARNERSVNPNLNERNLMSEVFVAEIGQLKPADKRELRKAGIAVVEVADLDKFRFMRSTELISGDDMLWAALDALCNTKESYGEKAGVHRERLARNLFKLVLDQRVPDPKPPKSDDAAVAS